MSDDSWVQSRAPVALIGSNSSGIPQGAITSGTDLPGDLMLHIQSPDNVTGATALGALNASVSMAVTGLASVGFQLAAGTLIGTIQAQCSLDGGTSWENVPFYNPANQTVLQSITFASSNTLTIVSILPIGGASNVRVTVSAYTSGTANGIIRASNVVSSVGAITAAAFNTVSLTYPTTVANTAVLLLAANANRKYAMISSPSTSIQVQLNTSTGLSTTTGFNIPSGGYYEFKGDNLYTGAIYGIASSVKTIAVTEGTP